MMLCLPTIKWIEFRLPRYRSQMIPNAVDGRIHGTLIGPLLDISIFFCVIKNAVYIMLFSCFITSTIVLKIEGKLSFGRHVATSLK